MKNGGCVLSRGSDANDVTGRVVMVYPIRAALYRIRTWRDHEVKARTKFGIDVIETAVGSVG